MSRGCTYTAGQCTDYVAKVYAWVGCWGDAWQWFDRAKAAGFATSSTPVIGSVAVWRQGAGASSNGHVAIVTGIQGNGLPIVSEMNATAGPFNVDQRSISAASAAGIQGYILPQQGAAQTATAATLTGIGLPSIPSLPGSGLSILQGAGSVTDVAGGIGKLVGALTSASFWWRAGFVVLGAGLIIGGVFMVAQESPSVQNAERMISVAAA